jgi:hypothetical protein
MTAGARPRILLAWECGAGRGHIMTLRSVAEALGDRFAYDAALCIMDHAAEISPLCDLVFPGARLYFDPAVRKAPGAPRTSTWGEFLGDTGFRDADFLVQQIRWWQNVLTARCTDLVVADYAPCALLAAQSMGIPTVAIGTGYGIPPAGLERFPVFLPEFSDYLYDEAETLAIVNAAVVPLGVPRLRHLSDIYRRSQDLVRTIDRLDPYHGLRDRPLLPPVADVATPSVQRGDEVFIYFSTTELADDDIVEAVCTLGLPVRAYCPAVTPHTGARLAASGVTLEHRPVPVELIARRSRMIVHAGQHGILCLGLAAGLPQIAIPQHLEQLYHARRCEAAGTGRTMTLENRTAAKLRMTIRDTYDDPGIGNIARTVAGQLREQFAVAPATLIRERIGSLL